MKLTQKSLKKQVKTKEIILSQMLFEITEDEYKQIKSKLIEDDFFIWYIFKSNLSKIQTLDKHIKIIKEIKATRIL